MKNIVLALGIFVTIWAGVFLPGLGAPELKGEEARRIIPGQNMLRSGDFLVMHIAGKVYKRKPPLVSWAAAAAFTITGQESEWAARLPSVAAMLLLGVGAFFLLRGHLGIGGALLAALMMVFSPGLIEKGRMLEIEAILVAFSGLAMLMWMVLYMRGGGGWLTYLLPAIPLGLAFLAKGLVPIFFYLGLMICVLWKNNDLRELRRPPFWSGIFLSIAMLAAWAIPSAMATADTVVGKTGEEGSSMVMVWIKEMAIRFIPTDPLKWIEQPLEGLSNFLPWLIFLPCLWLVAPPTDAVSGRRAAVFCGGRLSLAIGFLVIGLLPASEGRYTMPLIPQAAYLLAWALFFLPRSANWMEVARKIWFWFLVVAAALLFLAPLFWPQIAKLRNLSLTLLPQPINYLVPILQSLLPVIVLGVLVYYKKYQSKFPSKDRQLFLTILTCALLPIGMSHYAITGRAEIEKHDGVRPIGLDILDRVPAGEFLQIYDLDPEYQPFYFYLPKEHAFFYDRKNLDMTKKWFLVREHIYTDPRKTKDLKVFPKDKFKQHADYVGLKGITILLLERVAE